MDNLLIVNVKKINAITKKVVIKGQIEFLNMCEKDLRLQFKHNTETEMNVDSKNTSFPSNNEDRNVSNISFETVFDVQNDLISGSSNRDHNRLGHHRYNNRRTLSEYHNHSKPESSIEFELKSKSNMSLIDECHENINVSIRLRMIGNDKKGWSGEIPLYKTTRTTPWLVKIPNSTKESYTSYWIRVHRENISDIWSSVFRPQRILIVIWPMFQVRSLLPCSVSIYQVEYDKSIVLDGIGVVKDLEMTGTHETEHLLDIKIGDISNTIKDSAILSFKNIDRHKFFEIPKSFKTIEAIMEQLLKTSDFKWPCNMKQLVVSNASPSAVMASPIIKCYRSRDLSCSLLMDISPSMVFINSSYKVIKLTDIDTQKNIVLDASSLVVPPVFKNAFTISIKENGIWHSSNNIYTSLNTLNKKSEYFIDDDGYIKVILQINTTINYFHLRSYVISGIKILQLSAVYIISNYTNYNLQSWCFGTYEFYEREIKPPSSDQMFYEIPSLDHQSDDVQGLGICEFSTLSSKICTQPDKIFHLFFVLFNKSEREFSCPIGIQNPFNRKSICIRVFDNKYVAILISMIEHEGQFFISMYMDSNPCMKITNNTNLTLLIGESNTCELQPIKSPQPKKECNIEYFYWNQVIRPECTICYTAPSIDERFPNVCDGSVFIILAMPLDKYVMDELQWSLPISINDSKDNFVDLPYYGIIKVIVYNAQKPINIQIEKVVNLDEFNVRDIRTKILSISDNVIPVHNQANCWINNLPEANNFLKYDLQTDITHEATTMIESGAYEQRKPDVERSLNFMTKKINITVFIQDFDLVFFRDNDENNCLKEEIICIYLDGVLINFQSKTNHCELCISNLQVDNQLYSSGRYDFPVILCPQKAIKKKLIPLEPFNLYKDVSKQNDSFFAKCNLILFTDYTISSIYLKLTPMTTYIEDTYVITIMDYLNECFLPFEKPYSNKEKKINMVRSLMPGYVIVATSIKQQSQELAEPFFIRDICIEPVSVLLSVHTCLKMYIAIDHSPLDFDAFHRRNVITLPVRLGYNVGMHYVSGALFGVGWVVGSLEILGSPSGLARSFSTGLKDFVSLPFHGLFSGPWGFLLGVTQGSASLLKNITAGTINSVTKLAASFARNLDRLTLDDEHLRRTEALRRIRPNGMADGIAQGLTAFGISLLGAVGGLAHHPMQANSPLELMTGVGKGIVGAVTKPISAAAEMVALTGLGVLETVGYNKYPVPRRYADPKDISNGFIPTKIMWKYLPHILLETPVVLGIKCQMTLSDEIIDVVIALTVSFLSIKSVGNTKLLEVIPIEKLHPMFDEDKCILFINILSSEIDNVEISEYNYGRVLQFVHESSHRLTSIRNELEFVVPQNDAKIKDDSQRIVLLIDKVMGKYLVNYINLIQRDRLKFVT